VPGRWTICEEPGSRLFVMFIVSSCIASFRSVESSAFGWEKFGGLSAQALRAVRAIRVTHEPSEGRVLTIRFSRGAYWLFGHLFWTVR
jgi:hypothetical protein